jgi:hypothetical protein
MDKAANMKISASQQESKPSVPAYTSHFTDSAIPAQHIRLFKKVTQKQLT